MRLLPLAAMLLVAAAPGGTTMRRATGTMLSAGASTLDVAIAPGSGIAGNLSIEVKGGVHHDDLAYTLPAA